MSLIIKTLDNKQYDLTQYGLTYLSFMIDSLSPRVESENAEGADGHIDVEINYEGRTMTATYLIEATNIVDFTRLRDEVYKLFNGKSYFYLIDDRHSQKRWKVRTASKYAPEKVTPSMGTIDLDFVSPSPYAESINKVELRHTSNFTLHNIGDVDIDMVTQQETEIEFRGMSQGLTIRNNTTGQEWRYNGSTDEDDVICLKGIRSTKNGVSIFGQTNRKVLKFVPGWNDIEILNAEDYEITIRTRFYYI
ncbi:hypothetical protein CHH80_03420 [Bacillus sp. 7504-2]|nr:hypothetical protein CHH80_03420 [Bacillus sp. 7504-2]